MTKRMLELVQRYAGLRCRYCGAKTRTAVTCTAHRDLPPLDPHMAAWMRDTFGVTR